MSRGFTNLTGDLQDLITIDIDPDDPGLSHRRRLEPSEVAEEIAIAGENRRFVC